MKALLVTFALSSSVGAYEVTFEIVSSQIENTVRFSNDKSDTASNTTVGTMVAEIYFNESRTKITSFHFTGGRYFGSPYNLSFDFGKPPLSLIFSIGPTKISSAAFSPIMIFSSGIDSGTGILDPKAHYWFTDQGQIQGALGKLKQEFKDYDKNPECQLFSGLLQVELTSQSLDEVSNLITLTLSNTLDTAWDYELSKSYGPDDPGLKVSMTSKGKTIAIGTLVLPKVEIFPLGQN